MTEVSDEKRGSFEGSNLGSGGFGLPEFPEKRTERWLRNDGSKLSRLDSATYLYMRGYRPSQGLWKRGNRGLWMNPGRMSIDCIQFSCRVEHTEGDKGPRPPATNSSCRMVDRTRWIS